MLSLTLNILIVSEKPYISLDYRNGSVVEATAGQKSIKLLVKVSAYPTPAIHWYAQQYNCLKKWLFALHIHNRCVIYCFLIDITVLQLDKFLLFPVSTLSYFG